MCRILQQTPPPPFAKLACPKLRMEERQSGYRPASSIRCRVGQLHILKPSSSIQVFTLTEEILKIALQSSAFHFVVFKIYENLVTM
jgi:hypothetical protein